MVCLRHFLYLIAIICCLYAFPVRADFKCAPLQETTVALFKNGYGFLATAEIDGGAAFMWFVNQYGGFVILGVDDGLNACQIMHGTNLHFIMAEAI